MTFRMEFSKWHVRKQAF